MKIMHVKAQSPTGQWFEGQIACSPDGWPQFVQFIETTKGERLSMSDCSIELYHNLMGEAQLHAQVTQGESAYVPNTALAKGGDQVSSNAKRGVRVVCELATQCVNKYGMGGCQHDMAHEAASGEIKCGVYTWCAEVSRMVRCVADRKADRRRD